MTVSDSSPLDVASDQPCIVIGEVAQAHEGSLGMAHAFIDVIADAGANAIKFQTHIADAESTPEERFRVRFSLQDATRQAYWKRMEFTEEQWLGLAKHARDRGLSFLSSPFSIRAVELLERVGVAAWKIPSGEIRNMPMLDRIAQTGLPIILSSGMSQMVELDGTVEWVKSRQLPLAVLQCTTMYPCPPEKIGLNVIPLLRDRYRCPVGFSDHSGKIHAALAAATLGISVYEAHVTLSRHMFGPDVPASLTPEEFRTVIEGIHYIEQMRANPVDKDCEADKMADLRELFSQSVVVVRDLCAGTVLRREDLTTKKPGTGIPAARLHELIGSKLKHAVKAETLLKEGDLD
jgi:N,N'-diacetyllegionaminate synthase